MARCVPCPARSANREKEVRTCPPLHGTLLRSCGVKPVALDGDPNVQAGLLSDSAEDLSQVINPLGSVIHLIDHVEGD